MLIAGHLRICSNRGALARVTAGILRPWPTAAVLPPSNSIQDAPVSKGLCVARPVASPLALLRFGHAPVSPRATQSQGPTLAAPEKRHAAASPQTTTIALLIDGDVMGIDKIRDAISMLGKRGQLVSLALFAEPRRLDNQKWKAFVEHYSVRFHGVPRTANYKVDPCDDAMYAEALRLTTCDVNEIAIMTNDADFVPLVADVVARGKGAVVILALTARLGSGLLQKYRATAAEVIVVQIQNQPSSKVKVRLLADGSGEVDVLSRPESFTPLLDEQFIELSRYFEDVGHQAAEPTSCVPVTASVPKIAKLWFTNCLGSLVVYPTGFAYEAAYNALRAGSLRNAAARADNLAFVIPMTRKNTKLYGPAPMDAIVEGGGPFMLQGRGSATERFFRRMGFLDDSLNLDMEEAAFIFCQLQKNKATLKKVGSIDSSGRPCIAGLEDALFSDRLLGQWQLPPKDVRIRELLVRQSLLKSATAPKEAVLEAMRRLCRRLKLPSMKSYHGYVWQLSRNTQGDTDPKRRF